MQPSAQRFEVRQPSELFPARVWPFVLILAVLYYLSVVFEARLLFTVILLILCVLLFVRQRINERCILFVDQNFLKVKFKKGLLFTEAYTREYAWIDLKSFTYKQVKAGGYELLLEWNSWDDNHFSGKDLQGLVHTLQKFFPEKEVKQSQPDGQ